MEPAEIKTRRSLISRMRNWDDQEGWREFFDSYWRLIYAAAVKAGCDDEEAEDVVQETVLTVAKKLEDYTYQPDRCSFKSWLMHLTQWRIIDQVRKRAPNYRARRTADETNGSTPTVERVADPAGVELKDIWEEEWQRNLINAAMENVKRRVKADHYQIFYLASVKQVEARKVASLLGVTRAQIHLVKHRVGRLIKEEVHALERKAEKTMETTRRMK